MKDNEYSFESRAIHPFLIVSELASNNVSIRDHLTLPISI